MVVSGDRARRVQQDRFAVGPSGCPGPSAWQSCGRLHRYPGQVNISGLIAPIAFKPAQGPGQAIVDLDMPGREIKAGMAHHMTAPFMGGGEIVEMRAGPGKGGRPAAARCKHKDVLGNVAMTAVFA